MNEALINNWNKVVPEDGIIFILGDFIFTGNLEKTKEIVDKLNGKRKYLIYGNHDYQNKLVGDRAKKIFTDAYDVKTIIIEDPELDGIQSIILFHYPITMWASMHRGSWHLFGHVHTSEKHNIFKRYGYKLNPAQYDVGVDNNNYTPVSYLDIKKIITKQFFI